MDRRSKQTKSIIEAFQSQSGDDYWKGEKKKPIVLTPSKLSTLKCVLFSEQKQPPPKKTPLLFIPPQNFNIQWNIVR